MKKPREKTQAIFFYKNNTDLARWGTQELRELRPLILENSGGNSGGTSPRMQVVLQPAEVLDAREQDKNKTERLTWREVADASRDQEPELHATEKTTIKQKKKSLQKQAGEVQCEDYLLENVYNFDYLGSDLQADHKNAAIVRMGLAKSVFGNMMKIWKSDLALRVPIQQN